MGVMGGRPDTAKGGQEVGKWCSFYRLVTGFPHFETALTRLFPHKSTQVVDFPRIEHVRLFWEGHEIGFADQAELGTKVGKVK
jgi:hypothetical protein